MAERFSALLTSLALGLGTSACDTTAPAIPKDRMVELRRLMPGMTDECFETLERKGIYSRSTDGWRFCFRMTALERWKGVWLDGFEAQQFCPSPAQTCAPSINELWISFPNGGEPTRQETTDRLYEIEFIGRRTLKPGMHGHGGGFYHEIVVDRLISAKPLSPQGNE